MQDGAKLGSEYTQIEGRVFVALVLGLLSLAGLIFPPAIGLGITAIVLAWMMRKRIAASGGRLRGMRLVWAALVLGAIGSLLSLVLPVFVVSVWIYALFHGGQLPSGAP